MQARELERLLGWLSTEKEGASRLPAAHASEEVKNLKKFKKGKDSQQLK